MTTQQRFQFSKNQKSVEVSSEVLNLYEKLILREPFSQYVLPPGSPVVTFEDLIKNGQTEFHYVDPQTPPAPGLIRGYVIPVAICAPGIGCMRDFTGQIHQYPVHLYSPWDNITPSKQV